MPGSAYDLCSKLRNCGVLFAYKPLDEVECDEPHLQPNLQNRLIWLRRLPQDKALFFMSHAKFPGQGPAASSLLLHIII